MKSEPPAKVESYLILLRSYPGEMKIIRTSTRKLASLVRRD